MALKEHIFTLTYDMPETDEHIIDANMLGNSIISMAAAVKQADKLLNGEESSLNVGVKAHKEGSFAIEFLVSWLASGGIDVLKVIGVGGAAATIGGAGVLAKLKQIRNRNVASRIKIEGGDEWKLTLEDGSQIACTDAEEKLLNNHNFLERLDKVIHSSTIDSDQAKVIFTGEGDNKTILEPEETHYFKAPPKKDMLQNIVDTETKNIIFTHVNLEGKTGWKARLPSGDVKSVRMEDEAFLSRIENRERQFLKGDMFEVILKTEERILDGKSSVTRTIMKVIKHRVHVDNKIL